MKKLICCLLYGGLILVLTSGLSAQIKDDVSKSFKVNPGGELVIKADLGSIDVKTHSKNSVDVDIRFRRKSRSRRDIEELLEDFDLEMNQNGNDVTIRFERIHDDWDFWNSVGKYLQVKFLITVPTKYDLDLGTRGGSISVDDLEGKVFCKTSGGSLEFGNIKGDIDGNTSGGSINVDGCEGSADVHTSGGSIEIGHVKGNVKARTSGGGIHVDEVMGIIDAVTSGGSVSARITQQPKADCQLRTSGGGITVAMTRDVKVDVDASTSGGRVYTDFPVMVRGELSKRSLRASINGGGPEIYLRTSGGSIHIEEL